MTQVTRRTNFAAIPNEAMRDERISMEARGLLALMMGMGDRWVFRSKDLMKRSCAGKDKYQRMIRELKDAGYLIVHPKQGDGGKLDGFEYEIIDTPASRETRSAVDPVGGKPGPLRTPTDKNTNNKTPTPEGADLFGDKTEAEKEAEARVEAEQIFKAEINAGFEVFWTEIWPRHERKAGKEDCRKVYQQACLGKHKKSPKISVDDLNAATRRYIASVKDRQYLKAPLPWLRKPGWEPFISGPDGAPPSGKPMSYAQRLLAGQAR